MCLACLGGARWWGVGLAVPGLGRGQKDLVACGGTVVGLAGHVLAQVLRCADLRLLAIATAWVPWMGWCGTVGCPWMGCAGSVVDDVDRLRVGQLLDRRSSWAVCKIGLGVYERRARASIDVPSSGRGQEWLSEACGESRLLGTEV
jgi:hypothetical protein